MTHASPIQLIISWAEDVKFLPQALALGTYRHDIAYTGALKSLQWLALGTSRHDIAYTGALKSIQCLALGSYRHDIAYTGALKSILLKLLQMLSLKTGVVASASAPVLRFKGSCHEQ